MENTDDSGQAFPRAEGEGTMGHDGMSVRDYFAAHIIAALIQARATLDENNALSFSNAAMHGVAVNISEKPATSWAEDIAQDAYSIADEMVAVRVV